MVTREQVIGLCLDLGCRASTIGVIAKSCDELLDRRREEGGDYDLGAGATGGDDDDGPVISFAEFILLYGMSTQQFGAETADSRLPTGTVEGASGGKVVVAGSSYRFGGGGSNDNDGDKTGTRQRQMLKKVEKLLKKK